MSHVSCVHRWRMSALALLGVSVACGEAPATPRELEEYRLERGDLGSAQTANTRSRGRYRAERVRLESSTGLVATGWVYSPTTGTGCYPAALLENGREENSGVIDRLPPDFGDVVVLSLDYPNDMPYGIRLRDAWFHASALRRSAREVPAIFSLGASYLAQRNDVDSTRIALAATSFAVPFATIAAAMDQRFANVALVYGAGDLAGVLAANLQSVPSPIRRSAASVAMKQFAPFAPERFASRIAPRPLVMVNGSDDAQIPPSAVRRLYVAAGEPKTLIWLRTGHLSPTDSGLIRSLIDTAFAHLPVLRDTVPGSNCARSLSR
jgi:fermentation-respiration switch protein FrsA (DUF1100 family)